MLYWGSRLVRLQDLSPNNLSPPSCCGSPLSQISSTQTQTNPHWYQSGVNGFNEGWRWWDVEEMGVRGREGGRGGERKVGSREQTDRDMREEEQIRRVFIIR